MSPRRHTHSQSISHGFNDEIIDRDFDSCFRIANHLFAQFQNLINIRRNADILMRDGRFRVGQAFSDGTTNRRDFDLMIATPTRFRCFRFWRSGWCRGGGRRGGFLLFHALFSFQLILVDKQLNITGSEDQLETDRWRCTRKRYLFITTPCGPVPWTFTGSIPYWSRSVRAAGPIAWLERKELVELSGLIVLLRTYCWTCSVCCLSLLGFSSLSFVSAFFASGFFSSAGFSSEFGTSTLFQSSPFSTSRAINLPTFTSVELSGS